MATNEGEPGTSGQLTDHAIALPDSDIPWAGQVRAGRAVGGRALRVAEVVRTAGGYLLR